MSRYGRAHGGDISDNEITICVNGDGGWDGRGSAGVGGGVVSELLAGGAEAAAAVRWWIAHPLITYAAARRPRTASLLSRSYCGPPPHPPPGRGSAVVAVQGRGPLRDRGGKPKAGDLLPPGNRAGMNPLLGVSSCRV